MLGNQRKNRLLSKGFEIFKSHFKKHFDSPLIFVDAIGQESITRQLITRLSLVFPSSAGIDSGPVAIFFLTSVWRYAFVIGVQIGNSGINCVWRAGGHSFLLSFLLSPCLELAQPFLSWDLFVSWNLYENLYFTAIYPIKDKRNSCLESWEKR